MYITMDLGKATIWANLEKRVDTSQSIQVPGYNTYLLIVRRP